MERSRFKCELQHMSDSEMLRMLDADTMTQIRKGDPTPLIKVFGIGHEGDAKSGNKLFRYLQHSIRKLHDAVQSGVAVFNRHVETNSHEGRVKIGEVVGKSLTEIGGKLYSMAAVYLYPQFKDMPLDVASIEAEALYTVDGDGVGSIQDILNVTGIALSNHAVDAPGFPGATLLGAIQAFAANNPPGRKDTMTKEEIKAQILEGKLKPSDLFDQAALTADPVVGEILKTEKQTEYEHAKRVEKRLGEERDGRLADSKKFEEELGKLRTEVVKSTKGATLATLVTERKLDERQKKFVESHLADFTTDAADDAGVRKDLNTFIDKQLTQYNTIAEIFGVKKEEVTTPLTAGAGTPPSDGKKAEQVEDPTDLSDPKNNPLIPA